MRQMKQVLAVFLLLAMILTVFSACGTPSKNAGDSNENGASTNSMVKQETNVRDGWHLAGIPSYEGGRLSMATYNAGPGLMTDVKGTTEEDSSMQLAYYTTAEEFEAYLQKLKDYGYTETTKSQIENNIHAEYEGDGTLIYAYYTHNSGTARIIHDKSSSVSMADFAYSYTAQDGERIEVYQYGLYTAGGSLTTVNCGMSYVVKLSDNSVVLFDGGHIYQASDKATDGFMTFLHEITGTQEGETIRVAAYFVSHAHNDHMTFMAKVLHKYYHEIELQRVMFNFPSYQVKGGGYSIYYATWLKHIITTYYPKAEYKKLHTGETFNLGDLGIEVLYTHEDAVYAGNASVCSINDFNSTSTVLKLHMDGKTLMLLGDTSGDAEAVMTQMYTAPTFKSDIIQIAHHCFNYLTTLNAWIAPEIAFCPNSYANANSPGDNLPKLKEVTEHTGKDNVYYSGSGTYGFAVVDGELTLIYEANLVGGVYDGSGV